MKKESGIGFVFYIILVVIGILMMMLSVNNQREKQVVRRVEELAEICQTASSDLAQNKARIQREWEVRRAELVPGRGIGDLAFDSDSAQTIYNICSRVSDLQNRTRRYDHLKYDDRDKEYDAIMEAADIEAIRDAVNISDEEMRRAELAVMAIRDVDHKLFGSLWARDIETVREDIRLAEEQVEAGWRFLLSGNWDAALTAAEAAETYLSGVMTKVSPPTPTPPEE